MIDEPYFMTNEKWFYYDHGFQLTDKAPKKARDSYKEYMKVVNHGNNSEPKSPHR